VLHNTFDPAKTPVACLASNHTENLNVSS